METSLLKVQTGIFVETDKSKILINVIQDLLRRKYNVKAVSAPCQDNGKSEIVLYSLQPSGANFAASKVVLEHYFAMIKESRPNFMVEQKPEIISLDDDDTDLSVVCVGELKEEQDKTKGVISIIDLDCSEFDLKESETDKKVRPSKIIEGKSIALGELICIDDEELPTTISSEPSTSKLSSKEKNKPSSQILIDLDSSISDKNSQSSDPLPNSNDINRPVLKESNRQQQRKRHLDSREKVEVEVVEIPDDDIHLETNSSVRTEHSLPKKKKNNDEESSNIVISNYAGCNLIKSNQPSSNSLLKKNETNNVLITLKASGNRSQSIQQAVSSIVNSKTTAKSNPRSPKKTNFPSKHTPINIRDIPKQSPTKPQRGRSKLSYKKPAHLIQPLVKKISAGEYSSAAEDAQYNIYNAGVEEKRTGLRPIVIDGNNLGISHGKGYFSIKGIQICINYFEKMGNQQIKVFLPRYRINRETHDLIDKMERQGKVVITPSRRVDGKSIVSYDDRYIVQYAAECGGIIVSTDNFRDLLKEEPSWADTIKNRLLMFTWVDNMLMFPKDPLGKNGPTLKEFLKFPD